MALIISLEEHRSTLKARTAEALRLYRKRLHEAEAADWERIRALELVSDRLTVALMVRRLGPPEALDTLMPDLMDALEQMSRTSMLHELARAHLDRARDAFAVLEERLGFIPTVRETLH